MAILRAQDIETIHTHLCNIVHHNLRTSVFFPHVFFGSQAAEELRYSAIELKLKEKIMARDTYSDLKLLIIDHKFPIVIRNIFCKFFDKFEEDFEERWGVPFAPDIDQELSDIPETTEPVHVSA